jgi:hypothetical protein
MARIDKRPGDEKLMARANGRVSPDDVEIDRVLADSFPASDPPSWTLGVAVARETSDETRDGPPRSSDRGGR